MPMNKLGCICVAVCIALLTTAPVCEAAAEPARTVTATLQVKVTGLSRLRSDAQPSPIPLEHARIIVIDRDGAIIVTGLSNGKGNWTMPVRVLIDPRFPTKRMGMVTVIVIAEGYSEQLFFDTPVNQHGFGEGDLRVTLDRIIAEGRCEPRARNAEQLHRFTIFHTLDYYAARVGLEKRLQIDGELHWGPNYEWRLSGRKADKRLGDIR